MANAIDKLIGLRAIKEEVDAAYKEAELAASEYLEQVEGTSPVQVSAIFGPEAGEYKRGRSRARAHVAYVMEDMEKLAGWCDGNQMACEQYALANAEAFGQWWLETSGEVPDGIRRDEWEEPSHPTAPKLYRFDRERVKSMLMERGGLFEGAQLLLEGGNR